MSHAFNGIDRDITGDIPVFQWNHIGWLKGVMCVKVIYKTRDIRGDILAFQGYHCQYHQWYPCSL